MPDTDHKKEIASLFLEQMLRDMMSATDPAMTNIPMGFLRDVVFLEPRQLTSGPDNLKDFYNPALGIPFICDELKGKKTHE